MLLRLRVGSWTSVFVLLTALGVEAQTVTPAFPLATPVIGRVGDTQQRAVVAGVGSTAFAAWADRRDGRSTDLYGTRVTTAGVVLDAPSAPLVRGSGEQTWPALAASPSRLLLAYLDDAVGGCAPEVMALPLTLTGQPGTAVKLSTGACSSGARPASAFDGSTDTWLVAWGKHGAGAELHGTLLNGDGSVKVPDFVIASAANSALAPAVVATSLGFLVAWEDERLLAGSPSVYVTTVSALGAVGVPTRPAPPAGSAVQHRPALALSSSLVVLVWAEAATALASSTTIGATVLTEGGLSAGSPFVVKTSTFALGAPAAWEAAPGAWFIAWDDARGGPPAVFGLRADATGALSTEVALTAQPGWSRTNAALAPLGSDLLVVFQGEANDYVNGLDVLGTRVAAGNLGFAPTVSGPTAFTLGASATRNHSVNAAWDGARYLATWRDDGLNSAGADLVGQLLAPGTGAWLGPDAGLRLTTSSAILSSYPSVAPGGDGGFFVTWGDDGSATLLRGRRVSGAGASLDASPPRLNDVTPFVIDHDTRWFVDSWVTVFKQQFGNGLALRRTAPSGQVAEAEQPLCTSTAGVQLLRTAQSGDVLLTVFHATDAGLDVMGTRWRYDAGVVDAAPFLITQRPGNQVNPAVAGGPGLFLVAWSETDGGTAAADVYCTRVDTDAGVLDPPLLLSPGLGADSTPALSWTGASFLAVWVRDTTLVGARVSPAGVLLDSQPFLVSPSLELQANPRLVTGPPGESLLTYEAFDPSPGVQGIVARARFIFEGAPDGGSADAGPTDAGAPDAGSSSGTSPDAGPGEEVTVDGGVPPPDGRRLTVGCDCQTGAGPLCLALAVVFGSRPRRRRPGTA